MGFFSWKCAKSKISIPAWLGEGEGVPKECSEVVLVLPDDSTISGLYDGYGNISGVDVYDALAPFYFKRPDATREDIFNSNKEITAPDGTVTVIDMFNYETPIPEFDNRTMNGLISKGYKITNDFYKVEKWVKIVRADFYTNDKYSDLKTSERCPDQGFFYSKGKLNKIINSVNQN